MKYILSAFADEAGADLQTQIKALQMDGIGYMEIRNVNGKSIIDHTADELKAIKQTLDEAHIQVSAIGSPIGKIKITDDFEPHIEAMERTILAAKILHTKNIRMFSFYPPEHDSFEGHTDEVFRRLAVLIDMAKQAGVSCCHENEKDIFGQDIAGVTALINRFGADLKIVFDPANFLQSDVDAWQAYQAIKLHIYYFHSKDVDVKKDQVVPSGKGDGRVADILCDFKKTAEEDCFVTVEPHLAIFDGYQNLGDAQSIHDEQTYASAEEAFAVAVHATKQLI